MNIKDLTQSVIAILVVGGAVATLFFPVSGGDAAIQVMRTLAGAVIGFYFGSGSTPMFGGRR